jgi:hypothetical protein
VPGLCAQLAALPRHSAAACSLLDSLPSSALADKEIIIMKSLTTRALVFAAALAVPGAALAHSPATGSKAVPAAADADKKDADKKEKKDAKKADSKHDKNPKGADAKSGQAK